MREMHKLKDKVELSLDNRQIFFLFFGLSVLGCFAFTLGVMVGRRVDLDPLAAGVAENADPLTALHEVPEIEQPLAFQQEIGRPEPAAAIEAPAAPAAPPPSAALADPRPADAHSAPAVPRDPLLASVQRGGQPSVAGPRLFTLQMKAFARKEEADAFAAKLRSDGHAVLVEPHEVRGRIWHRVRMGEFEAWEAALAAKTDFEKAAKTIAYVVRK